MNILLACEENLWRNNGGNYMDILNIPFKVGSVVYIIKKDYILETKITKIVYEASIGQENFYMVIDNKRYSYFMINRTVFFDKEEAKKMLEKYKTQPSVEYLLNRYDSYSSADMSTWLTPEEKMAIRDHSEFKICRVFEDDELWPNSVTQIGNFGDGCFNITTVKGTDYIPICTHMECYNYNKNTCKFIRAKE